MKTILNLVLRIFGIETSAMRAERVREMQTALDWEHDGDGYDYIRPTKLPRSASKDYNFKVVKTRYREAWDAEYAYSLSMPSGYQIGIFKYAGQ